jgi:hypothetical protein
MRRLPRALAALSLTAAVGATALRASDEPIELMPGKITVIKAGKLAKFIAKPTTGTFDLPDAANDPTTDGGTLRLVDLGNPAAGQSWALPSSGWEGLGSPAGTKGYKYKGAGTPADPCKTVLVKDKIVKAICKGTAVDFDQPFEGALGVALTIGAGSKNYCTAFAGSALANLDTQLKRKDAPAPTCACNGTPSTLTLRNTPPTDPICGTVEDITGATADLACNGLYLGSGNAALTLPATVPDSVKAIVTNVTCCAGTDLLLGASTATETADGETCTEAGCKFGPPLPIPNQISTATSTCVINTYARDVVGEASCATGAVRLDLPLLSTTYLTGDLLVNRCSGGLNPGLRCTTLGADPACTPGGGTCVADPDLQPCPICNVGTNVCNGGPNNGMACVPDGGVAIAADVFPTSHDCPPPALLKIGDLPTPFLLSTGTQVDTAVPSGSQQRVFCGHCRDIADGPSTNPGEGGGGAFGVCTAGSSGVGRLCAVTGDCGVGGVCEATPCGSAADCDVGDDEDGREACEQKSNGAFGPNGGANMTITGIGTPSGDLTDHAPHAGTLVSVFCIPPSFNGIIDGSADLPGPGATSLPGLVQLNL